MNDLSPKRQDKFRAYRARKKAAGLREIRMWVPDIDAPGFQERLDRAAAVINASFENQEILDWIETATANLWGKPY